MNNFFLKLKHWQIFVITFVLPMVLMFVFMFFFMKTIIDTTNQGGQPDPKEIFGNMKYMYLIFIIPQVFHFLVFWSKGVGLQKYMPSGIKMKLGLFKASQIVPVVYLIIALGGMFYLFDTIFANIDQSSGTLSKSPFPPEFFSFIFLIFPLNLISIASAFFGFYFIAKTVKSIQLGKEANFGDFVGEFFLLWFYIIGMWITQPLVNDIVNGKYEHLRDKDLELGQNDEDLFKEE